MSKLSSIQQHVVDDLRLGGCLVIYEVFVTTSRMTNHCRLILDDVWEHVKMNTFQSLMDRGYLKSEPNKRYDRRFIISGAGQYD